MRKSPSIVAGLCALLLAGAPGQYFFAQAAPAAQNQPAPAAQSQGAQQDSVNELSVGVGKTILVDTAQPIARISVGIGDVAVASAVNRTEVMVNGKAPGETNLIIWDVQGNRQFFNVSVRASDAQVTDRLEGVRRELRTELPQENLRVNIDNGTIFLRGTVPDLVSAERAVTITSTAGKVVNLLDVKVPESDPQILLKVRFVSVDRSISNQLGINFQLLGLGNVIGAVTTGQFSPPVVTGGGSAGSGSGVGTGQGSASFSNEGNILAFFPGLKASADITALESRGLLQLLAEPNVMATNGKQASFLAGGQYPYPVVQAGAGSAPVVTIQFKDYGIRLNFIPTITPRGTIRLQVAPEVSALDYANSVTISGFTVPGITTRKVNTEVELAERQSFIIGGLLDNSISQTFQKIPFIGDIPIIGKLFQSISRTRNNTELIVIVTPEIVSPIPAGQPLPSPNLPQQFMAPNSNIPMNTPDARTAAAAPAPTAIPMEKLIESMKPEAALPADSGSSYGGGGTSMSGGGVSGGTGASGAPPGAGAATGASTGP